MRPATTVPTFDVVRIGPDGRAVIGGRAQPGANVALFDGGAEIGQTRADQSGEWVMIVQEPPLSVGQHELRVLQHIEDSAPVVSDQVVMAVVAKIAVDTTPPQTDSANPAKELLPVTTAPLLDLPSVVQAPPTVSPASVNLKMSTLDYDEHGCITITGQASADAVVRAYVDGKILAEDQTDIDGRWRLAPSDSVPAGHHKLRLDVLAKDGRPVARFEVPFQGIVRSPTGDTRQFVVMQGDSLWNIARAHYGDGMRHMVIFGANKDQIRNPDLIYPGQVFTLPNQE
jgi:nucleoid-associated protein YgaU